MVGRHRGWFAGIGAGSGHRGWLGSELRAGEVIFLNIFSVKCSLYLSISIHAIIPVTDAISLTAIQVSFTELNLS